MTTKRGGMARPRPSLRATATLCAFLAPLLPLPAGARAPSAATPTTAKPATPRTASSTPTTARPATNAATKPATTGKAGTATVVPTTKKGTFPTGVSATVTTRPTTVKVTPIAPPKPGTATVADAVAAVAEARRKGDPKALVAALRLLGVRQLEAKKTAESIAALREAVSILSGPANAVDRRDTEATLGWALNTAGQFAAGVTVLQDALKLADSQHATPAVTVNIVKLLVWGARAAADHPAAVVALDRLRQIGEAGDTSVDLGDTYEGLAVERLLQKDVKQAVADARKAVALRASAKPELLAGSNQVLGWALDTADQSAEAVTVLKKAVELRRSANLPAAANLDALLLLANAARKAGDVETSLAARRDVIQIARDKGDNAALADGLDELGLAALLQQRPQTAVAPLTESVALRRKNGASVAFGRSLHLLGWALANSGRLDDAIGAYNEAAEIRRQVGDTRDAQLESLRALGFALWTAKRAPDSIQPFERALALVRQAPTDATAEAGALTDLAVARLIAAQPDKAIEPAQSALAIYDRIGTTKGEPLAAALYAYGWALFSSGKQKDAIEPFKRSLALREAAGSDKVDETKNFLQAAVEASNAAGN